MAMRRDRDAFLAAALGMFVGVALMYAFLASREPRPPDADDQDEDDLSCDASGLGDSEEKAAMLDGRAYDSRDGVLVRERKRAQRLCHLFNSTGPHEAGSRSELLRRLLPGADPSAYVEPPFRCDYGHTIELGAGAFVNYNCVVLDCARVAIGPNTLLGPGVQVYTARHPVDPEERLGGLESALPVRIGANCWIGGGAVICPGATIGDNVVVGAGSVVTGDLPDNCVAVGNPCRVRRGLEPPATDPRAAGLTWK